MFDPDKTLAVVTLHPGKPGLVNPGLIEWLREIHIPLRRTMYNADINRYDVTVTFNRAIVAALTTSFDNFIFCDFDMNPEPGRAAPFLASDADLVGAEFDAGSPGCWTSGDIHSGFWRTSRAVLESILSVPGRPRWFEWKYAEDGGKHDGCHCVSFCEKVRAAGWKIEVAGKVGHMTAARRGW